MFAVKHEEHVHQTGNTVHQAHQEVELTDAGAISWAWDWLRNLPCYNNKNYLVDYIILVKTESQEDENWLLTKINK